MPEGSFLLPLRVLLLPSHVLVLPESNLLLTYFQLLPLRVPLLPERVFVWYSLHLIRASQNLAIYSNRFSGLGTDSEKLCQTFGVLLVFCRQQHPSEGVLGWESVFLYLENRLASLPDSSPTSHR